MTDESDTEAGYEGLDRLRNLLAIALVLGEGWYLYEAYKDTPNGLILRARFRAFLSRVAQPCQKCREWQKAKAQMHYQAYEAVMDARAAHAAEEATPDE